MFQPRIPPRSAALLAEALEGGMIGQGQRCKDFEEAFCAGFGLPRALAVNSGTAALHLALLSLGIGVGDEVITSAQTFVATALAVKYVGADPVFADLKPGSPNLDPSGLESKLSPRTKAVLVVHYGGMPCDMEAILDFASRRGLAVIEDAAQALGAEYKGKPAGTLGAAAAFSFQAIKGLTTGDGGMLVLSDPEAHGQARRRRWFGIDKEGRKPDGLGPGEWEIRELGFKYAMNDLAASLGLGALDSYPEVLLRRRLLDREYRAGLSKISGLELLEDPQDRKSACWLFSALVTERRAFVEAMRCRGVEASVWHRRIDRHPIFGGLRQGLPQLERFDREQVSLPLRESLSDEEAGKIIKAVQAGW
jgi:perosamine synthetase